MDGYDVFVSYAREDDRDGWVSGLVDSLRRQHARFTPRPLRVFHDVEAIRAMDDWEHRILGALRSSKVLVAVVSPAFLRSEYCRREWQSFARHEVARGRVGELIAPIWITDVSAVRECGGAVEDDWLVDVQRRQGLDVSHHRPCGIETLGMSPVADRLAELEQRIAELIGEGVAVDASRSTVPPHNPTFVGRRDEMRWIRASLAFGGAGTVAALHGLPGVGKSGLAFEYAHAYARDYPGGRYLLGAAGADDLRTLLLGLAEYCGVHLTVAERRDIDGAFRRVRAALETGPRCLLVLDNAESDRLLSPQHRAVCLPANDNVHVLVTTRLEPRQLPGIRCLPVDALLPADGVDLLDLHRPLRTEADRDAARRIVARVGGFPIALEILAVHLWQTPEVSYPACDARLATEGLMALDDVGRDAAGALSRHPHELLRELLAPTLAALSDGQYAVVEWASVLPPDRVPMPWLHALSRNRNSDAAVDARPGYADPWLQTLRRLEGLRLLTSTHDPRIVRMHRLVQESVRARMGSARVDGVRHVAAGHVLERAAALEEGWTDRNAQWEVDSLFHVAENMLAGPLTAQGLSLVKSAWKSLRGTGRFTEARSVLRRAIELHEDAGGASLLELAESCCSLGVIEAALGRLAGADAAYDRAIAIYGTVGVEDAELAVVLSNKAEVRRQAGDLDGAARLLERATAVLERVEPDTLRLAAAYNNSALVHEALGNFDLARRFITQAIAIDERWPGSTEVAHRYSNLALLERHLGHFEVAREMILKAIEIDEAALPTDHPLLCIRYANLGLIERDRGQLDSARDHLRRAVAMARKTYEQGNPSLAIRVANLSLVERDAGNLAEARRLAEEAVQVHEGAADTRGLYLARAYTNLALVERDLGALTEARRLAEAARAIQERQYRAGHPWLADTYFLLGRIDADEGHMAAARTWITRCHELRRRQTPDHPATREASEYLEQLPPPNEPDEF